MWSYEKSGADLRKVIMTAKGMTSSEGLRGIEYQLLNALAVRNVNKFMDVVMRFIQCIWFQEK